MSLTLVRKKDGKLAKFDKAKIKSAALKAAKSVGIESEEAFEKLAEEIEDYFGDQEEISYNEIHTEVELRLMDINKEAAKAYIIYRKQRADMRADKDPLIEKLKQITKETSKDNANIHNSPASKMYEAGSLINTYYTLNHQLPKEIAQAHIEGDIHIHDLNYHNMALNCIVYDLSRLLTHGFTLPHGFIRPPKSIMAATALTAVSLQAVQNDQYGGCATNDIDTSLAPWVSKASERELDQAVEGMLFNLNTLHSRAGRSSMAGSYSDIAVGDGKIGGS